MRVYRVDGGERFVEYERQSFSQENLEATLQAWLAVNSDAILEDSKLLIIGREVPTNLGTYIDLLGIDRDGNVVVVELKRAETPRTTLAQALEYASYAAILDYDALEAFYRSEIGNETVSLGEAHRGYFGLLEQEAVAFNKEQRVVIVGHVITPQIRQAALYLRERGLPVTCVEFAYFETQSREQLLTIEIVVGHEPLPQAAPASAGGGLMSAAKMLASAGMAEPLLEALLALDGVDGICVRWSAKTFSLRVELDGVRPVLLYAYVAGVWFSKDYYCLYTDSRSLILAVEGGAELVAEVNGRLAADALWQGAGADKRCVIDHPFSQAEIDRVVAFVRDLGKAVLERGRAGGEDVADEAAEETEEAPS